MRSGRRAPILPSPPGRQQVTARGWSGHRASLSREQANKQRVACVCVHRQGREAGKHRLKIAEWLCKGTRGEWLCKGTRGQSQGREPASRGRYLCSEVVEWGWELEGLRQGERDGETKGSEGEGGLAPSLPPPPSRWAEKFPISVRSSFPPPSDCSSLSILCS